MAEGSAGVVGAAGGAARSMLSVAGTARRGAMGVVGAAGGTTREW